MVLSSLLGRLSRARTRPGPAIVAIRDDGLCMRLNTILDAMLIARAMGMEMGFHWDETAQPARDQQTTDSLAAVFDAAFLRHHRPGSPDRRAPVLDKPLRDAADVAAARAAGMAAGQLLLDQPRHLAAFFAGLGPFAEDAYATAFAAIGFAAPVRAAIAAARALPVAPGAVAIHLRGGDILHGTHAYHGAYLHKAPSLAEIDSIIAARRAEGQDVWLIGQEPDIQSAMVARHSGTRALGITDPLPAELGPVDAVLFDAVLMARMAHLFGGNSGVTLLSRRLGGTGFTDIGRPSAAATGPLDLGIGDSPAFAGVSAAAQAHVHVKAVVATPPADWTPVQLDRIRAARAIRPANAFLQLVETCLLARLSGPATGESAARALLCAPPLEPGIPPEMGFSFLTGGAETFPAAMVAQLDPGAGPASALLVAVGRAVSGDLPPDAARDALARTSAALAPVAIDPALRGAILSCLDSLAPPG